MPDAGFVHPFSPHGRQDADRAYAWLAEHEPLYADTETGAVLLTRYADCDALLRSRGASTAQEQRGTRLPKSMLTTDPPEHTRLRAIGARLVGPASVEALRAGIEQDADTVLAVLSGVVDAHGDIGIPYATRVIARLIDVLPDQLDSFTALALAASATLDPRSSSASGRRAAATLAFFLRSRLAVSQTLRQWVDEAGCTDDEAVGVLSLCVIGGMEPLAVVAAASVFEYASGPVADSSGAVEEVLRLQTPIPFVARLARTDVPLPSGTVAAGTRVLVLLDAANRDPAASASGHLSFGAGPHFCLGAPLVQLALSTLLERAAALRWTPVDEPRDWASSLIPRHRQPLRVRLG